MGYAKGAAFERQLRALLEEKGFFVVRASASGVDGLSPDLVALHTTKKFAVECKAWNRAVNVSVAKMRAMQEWQSTTGLPVYLAWKLPRREWRFYPLAALRETLKGFSLHQSDWSAGMTLEELLR